ncbi:MAG: penicillin-binding protein 2 [Kofleriaceae bacterium]|nr:penicillin-binding protein 2 [Kofleriaceae bacterium]MBP9172772.1 penicillin-binding protein 2 [Kofleriaceae bacterium]MBP9862375.1 penicillin-binding protein 2 [Kofleriaceae bacterium]
MLIEGGARGGGALPPLTRRLRWVFVAMLVGFGGLVLRLWWLQVLRGDRYRERTVSNVVHERYLPSIRGRILDRNGVALADNRAAFNLYAPAKTVTPELRVQLKRMLGLTEDDLAKIDARIATATKRKVREPILLLEDISYERAARIDQERFRLPGLEVRNEPYRHYPHGDLAAHLVGYMTQMNAEEAQLLAPQGYGGDELVGRYGLETVFENYLRGKKGKERYAVDARGRRLDDATAAGLIAGDRVTEPVAGYSLVLTIDADLQRIAERAVAPYPASAVAVVEIATGKVLALVSKPSFNPNVMTGHLTKAEAKFLEDDPRKPFIDKALRVPYPPGSIFKFVTTIAALEDGQGREEEGITCKGSHTVAGDRRPFDCTSSHGHLDLVSAIQHSCNVYFWTLAERVGLDRIAEVANQYGFGTRTGLGLNGDAPGRVPTRAWYEQRGRFMIGYTINGSTGQGDVEVTVMQVAMAYAALANGGTVFVPQVVDRLVRADGATVIQYQPQVKQRVATPPEILDIWRRGTWKAVNEPGGTAFEHATSEVVAIAGKTGTAQVAAKKAKKDQRQIRGWSPNGDHAWFAGVAPAEAPEVAIVVLIEHGGPGGKVAGPVAKLILEGWASKVRGHAAAPGALSPEAVLRMATGEYWAAPPTPAAEAPAIDEPPVDDPASAEPEHEP